MSIIKLTSFDKIATASECLTDLRLMPLTDKIASPTNNSPHLSPGCPECISDMRMGTPCSLPPVMEIPRPSCDCFIKTTVRVLPIPFCDLSAFVVDGYARRLSPSRPRQAFITVLCRCKWISASS